MLDQLKLAKNVSKNGYIFSCPQCPKMFATRSNLKRHMENPNIHNTPYSQFKDQMKINDFKPLYLKQLPSKQGTAERMRKWRAENRDKNKQNDLRCRVYRLARQKYGEIDSKEKEKFIQDEINRRMNRRLLIDLKDNKPLNELPFYSAPLQKIELPLIDLTHRRSSQSTEPAEYVSSQPSSPTDQHPSIEDNLMQYSSIETSITNTLCPPHHINTQYHNNNLPPMQNLHDTFIPRLNSISSFHI